MAGFEICAVGHITNELIVDTRGNRRHAIGGAAYYAGVALASLGMRTLVVSAVAKQDMDKFAAALHSHNIAYRFEESPCTTTFENTYEQTTGRRSQRIRMIARSFRQSDLAKIGAGMIHLGPLTPKELPLECVAFLSGRGARLSLDLQGFVRDVTEGIVRTVDWPAKSDYLKYIHILKANFWEAQAVTGEKDPVLAARRLATLGPNEIIVTRAEKGAILWARGAVHDIPARPVSNTGDPTGCGDSFCAGYVFARLRGRSPQAAATFAAALAAEKRRRQGPFTGSASAIETLIKN